MKVVADTNTFLAVALGEPERDEIIRLTIGHELVAPFVLPFEMGNAITAMLKRGALTLDEVIPTWDAVQAIPVELRDVDIGAALRLACRFSIYAYDACFLECALASGLPIITLDRGMQVVARSLGIELRKERT